MKTLNEYQTVTLVFDDGTRATFTGKAQVDVAVTMRIRDVLISEPKLLPANCSFEQLVPAKSVERKSE